MIPSIAQPASLRWTYKIYILMFYIFLVAPLLVVATFAFNDSLFPSLPWNGFTLDWFVSDTSERLGVFSDSAMLESVGISAFVAFWVTALSLLVATSNAFLFERYDFRFKEFFYMLMLLPLVIPGVILGISILIASNSFVNAVDEAFNIDVEFLRPGLVLVILGQFAFITTIATMVISARLRKMDRSLEEAAYNLGATKSAVLRTITLPYLKPALVGAGIVAFLMSFENFNTTLMLTSSDSPLTITMFDRLREGSTPELNAVSLLLMIVSGILALLSVLVQKKEAS